MPSGSFGRSSNECSVVIQTGEEREIGVVGPPHCTFLLTPNTQMNRLFNKRSEKPLKPSQRHVSLGIPTNVAIGPLGFRAELDIEPLGGWGFSPHDLGADRTGSTAVLDENDTRASRIVFYDKKSEDRKHPTLETSNHSAVIGGDEHGDWPISECL